MSEKLKDLIEKAEEDEQTRAMMEKTIENLKIEVQSLKSKLDAQKEPFKPPVIKSKEQQEDTEEIGILKELITSLRDEVNQKDQEKEMLSTKVKTLSNELNEMKEKESDTIKQEILLKTQNSLNKLIEDYSKLESNNKLLKQKIAELELEKSKSIEEIDGEISKLGQSERLNHEITSLRSQISSLEQKNQSLLQNIELLETKSSTSEEFDELFEKLRQNNVQLENENKELSEKLEELKREKLKTLKYEREISDLTSKIAQLEDANKVLRKRDSILLAKTINAMEIPPRTNNITNLQLPKVKPLIVKPPHKIANELEEPEGMEVKPIAITPKTIQNIPKEPLIPKIEEANVVAESTIETGDEDTTRKWQCPNCGNTNKAQIRELDDKTRLIYSYPKIYAKKYICGQCGKEWK